MFKPLLITLLTFAFTSNQVNAADKIILPIATENYPPYEMLQPVDGLKGFDYEVMVEIYDLLGYEIDVQFLPWKRALAYTKLGKVLGILTCAYREERDEYMIFSDPISKLTNGYYVRAGFKGPVPVLLEDVKGQKVGSITAYESFKALAELGLEPIGAKNTKTAINMLRSKRFDYLYVNQQSTDFTINQLGLAGTFKFYPMNKKEFFFCFSRQYEGVEEIVDEFNKALFILKKNGTYKKIHDKYR